MKTTGTFYVAVVVRCLALLTVNLVPLAACSAPALDPDPGARAPEADEPEVEPAFSDRHLGWLAFGDRMSSRVDQYSGSQLDVAAADYVDAGFVITAVTTNTAGYTLFGAKNDDVTLNLESRVDQFSGSQIDAAAAEYASGGYVITAVTTNTAGYTLFGVRERDADTDLQARVDQFSGPELDDAAAEYANAGFVITSVTFNTAGYTLFGVRSASEDTDFETRVDQFSGPELDEAAAEYTRAGFVITAVIWNDAGYTLFGVRDANRHDDDLDLASRVDQFSGSGLDFAAADYAGAGYVVTTVTTNDSGYTLFGIGR